MIWTKAAEVTEGLRKHLTPSVPVSPAAVQPRKHWPGGLYLTEVKAPAVLAHPGIARRADAIWVPTIRKATRYPARQAPEIHVYEVKTRRADLRVELAHPEKHEVWKSCATFFWLALGDENLMRNLTIPDDWGIVAPPRNVTGVKMRVLRPARRLNPDPTRQLHALHRVMMNQTFKNWQQKVACDDRRWSMT